MRRRAYCFSLGFFCVGVGVFLCAVRLRPTQDKYGVPCLSHTAQVYVPAAKSTQGVTAPLQDGGAFWIDIHEVSNSDFERFVAATGYETTAEVIGFSAVFQLAGPDGGTEKRAGWARVDGANWRWPDGPQGPEASAALPVVHVTFADASAYAEWAGGRIPTEAEWQRAALSDEFESEQVALPDTASLGNTWQGLFPLFNTVEDGYPGVAPVGCFPANALGIYDILGNVWEWSIKSEDGAPVIKGGSYLCSSSFCRGYDPKRRQYPDAGLPASHIGFRLAYSDKPRRKQGDPKNASTP